MSIASNRSRRPNAGSKMNEIANSNKEDDEFYKKTYGGFVEEENDNDFEPGSDDDVADESIGKNVDTVKGGAVDSIRKNGMDAKDDREHPPAKRLKTEAKAYDEAECDDDDDDEDAEDDDEDDEDDEDDDDDDDDEEGDDEDDDDDECPGDEDNLAADDDCPDGDEEEEDDDCPGDDDDCPADEGVSGEHEDDCPGDEGDCGVDAGSKAIPDSKAD